jgi:hypothetical protein
MKKFFTYVKLTIGTLVIAGIAFILSIILAVFGILSVAWVITALLIADPDD